MSKTHRLLTPAEVRRALDALGYGGLTALSKRSKVSLSTLNKIRRGETLDPGLATVNRFWRHLR